VAVLKSDIINGAYSLMRISGITVTPSTDENTLALSRLEAMAEEWKRKNIAVDYNFEATPLIGSVAGIALKYKYAFETNLAVRLISDFGKGAAPDGNLAKEQQESFSFLLPHTPLLREIQSPFRKLDLLNGAYSLLNASQLMIDPGSTDNILALNRLEDMAELFEAQNIKIGYNFEVNPSVSSAAGIARKYKYAFEVNLAVRLFSNFGKGEQPDAALLKEQQELSSLLAIRSPLTRDVQFPTRKLDIINGAYSFMGITDLISDATPSENMLALRRLEMMASEFFGRGVCVGYHFEDTPDENSLSGLKPEYQFAFEAILGVRLMPNFKLPVDPDRRAQSSAQYAFLLSQSATVRTTQYSARMPLGSGNRYGRQFRRFYTPAARAPQECATNKMFVGDVQDFTEHFEYYLEAGERISTYNIGSDDGLTIVSNWPTSTTDIYYRIRADNSAGCNSFQQVEITVTTSAGRIITRNINFAITESAEISTSEGNLFNLISADGFNLISADGFLLQAHGGVDLTV